jgi:hypothetical protein
MGGGNSDGCLDNRAVASRWPSDADSAPRHVIDEIVLGFPRLETSFTCFPCASPSRLSTQRCT